MLYFLPSNEMDLVRPVMACFVEVYGEELGLGVWADIDPLFIILQPMGSCSFIIRKAS